MPTDELHTALIEAAQKAAEAARCPVSPIMLVEVSAALIAAQDALNDMMSGFAEDPVTNVFQLDGNEGR